jgi:hypothetical protein
MKKFLLATLMAQMTISLVGCNTDSENGQLPTVTESHLQRIIVTTDIGGSDPDDEESMVHLLLMSNDLDVEGLICGEAFVKMTPGVSTLNKIIKAYDQALPNLLVHSKDYPTTSYLRSIVATGQTEVGMAGVGNGKDSKGSELIINAVDKDDARPIWLTSWCGMNTIAQALWKVKQTRSAADVERFISKIRIYDILGQDDAGSWIVRNFPNIFYIRNKDVYGWGPSDDWVKKNIQAYAPMGTVYPNRAWATEGDSPSFFYLVDNGLNVPEKMEYGSWGGRFSTVRKSDVRGMDWVEKNGMVESQYDPYFMYTNTLEGGESISKWKDDINNDFAARIQWSVTSDYKGANHHPIVVLDNEKSASKDMVERTIDSSSDLTFDASRSYDPDGNDLHYYWFYYKEVGTYSGNIPISNARSSKVTIKIPSEAKGKTIHIILEISDSGTPSLTSYRRLVLHIN